VAEPLTSPPSAAATPAAAVAYHEELLRRLQEIAGIDAATLPDKLPLALNDLLKAVQSQSVSTNPALQSLA